MNKQWSRIVDKECKARHAKLDLRTKSSFRSPRHPKKLIGNGGASSLTPSGCDCCIRHPRAAALKRVEARLAIRGDIRDALRTAEFPQD